MSTLLYILVKSMKNRLLEIVRKPAKLILYLLCIGGMVGLLIMSLLNKPENTATADIIWLKGFYFALMTMFVVIAVIKGLSNGDTIFEMQDVNLLFVSPVSPKLILMYGLVQMTKMAFWAGFFIFFQGGSIAMFGKGFSAIVILFVSFILTIVLLSILSLVLYNLTNGRPERKSVVRILTAAAFLPLPACVGFEFLQSGNILTALENALHSPVFSWTPFAGWSAEAAIGMIAGDIGTGALFTVVSILSGALLMAYILLGNIDYYEDVLVATETAFERKRALSEGQMNPEAMSGGKVRVAKTGVGGVGANVFLYKHLRETLRANRFGLLSWQTVFMVIGAGVLAYMMRDEGTVSLTILQVLMWLQVFLIGTGRGIKELSTHYIYLIPESSFGKIVWSNLEPVTKVLFESILIFGISGLIAGDSFIIIVGSIAVFTLFSMMLLGINYLSMRWFGTEIGVGILLILYILAVMILLLPGLIGALVVGFTVAGLVGTAAGLGILALWEFIAAIVCFALAKGVLHHCDIQTHSK